MLLYKSPWMKAEASDGFTSAGFVHQNTNGFISYVCRHILLAYFAIPEDVKAVQFEIHNRRTLDRVFVRPGITETGWVVEGTVTRMNRAVTGKLHKVLGDRTGLYVECYYR